MVDFINGLFVTIAPVAESLNFNEEGLGSEQSLRSGDSKSGSRQELTESQAKLEDGSESDEESDSDDDDDDDEEEEDSVAAEGLEDKLRNIKDTSKVDPTNQKLGIALNLTLGSYVTLLIVALIILVALAKPEALFEFGDHLNEQATLLNDVINTARILYLKQHAVKLTTALTSKNATQNYWPCTWDSKNFVFNQLDVNNVATGVNKTLKPCPFTLKYDSVKQLEKYTSRLHKSQEWFTNAYSSLRVEGDVLDQVYNAEFHYYEFDKGADAQPSFPTAATWPDFIGSKVIDSVDKLSAHHDITESESRLDWQFIVYNRDVMTSRLTALQYAVYDKVTELLNTEATIHLIFTILTLGLCGFSFFVLLVPRIRNIQAERLLLLKLLLLVPKSLVWDFVNRIYKDTEEDKDELDDGQSGTTGKSEALKAKAMKRITKESVDIVNDNAWALYLFFGIGLLSISIPLIVHVAWRYSFNTMWADQLHDYTDVLGLYTEINALLWRSTGLWALTTFVEDKDKRFWANISYTSSRLSYSADKVFFPKLTSRSLVVTMLSKMILQVKTSTVMCCTISSNKRSFTQVVKKRKST